MDRVVINVCGTKSEVSIATFQKLAALGNSRFLNEAILVNTNEYFLERSPLVFGAVIQFLTLGELHLPLHTCPHAFVKELEFWGVGLDDVKTCCQNVILMAIEESDHLDEFERDTKSKDQVIFQKVVGISTLRHKIWLNLNEPCYSRMSMAYTVVAGIFVLLSVFVFITQTHHMFQRSLYLQEWKDYLEDEYPEDEIREFYDDYVQEFTTSDNEIDNKTRISRKAFVRLDYLTTLEYATTIFFTFDILLRFITCPRKVCFLVDFFNIADLIALVAVLSHFVLEQVIAKERFRESVLDIVSMLQILRILRFFRIIRRVRGFRVLVYSMKAGIREFLTVTTFVLLTSVSFGALIYFLDGKSKIKHIPDGIYWALITVTTVGYGDLTPVTFRGKIIACLCAMLGVLLTAVTVPVFVNNFIKFYSHAGVVYMRQKLPKTSKLIKPSDQADPAIEA